MRQDAATGIQIQIKMSHLQYGTVADRYGLTRLTYSIRFRPEHALRLSKSNIHALLDNQLIDLVGNGTKACLDSWPREIMLILAGTG